MQSTPVTSGLRQAMNRSINPGRTRNRASTALAEHMIEVDGIPVSIVIERPEVDRAGIAWRCRLRVVRGNGRIEHSQVVGSTSSGVLQQALDLASERLGVSEAELMAGAEMGGALG
ncbi:MAG: hypothetical protein J2P18_09895 [Nocardia sp.]|nr:hypothetical protein [Nocardia sp.]